MSNLDKLPPFAVVAGPDGAPVYVLKGVSGYVEAPELAKHYSVEEANALIGVSPAEAKAMEAGSMFGFDVPAADPDNYPEAG